MEGHLHEPCEEMRQCAQLTPRTRACWRGVARLNLPVHAALHDRLHAYERVLAPDARVFASLPTWLRTNKVEEVKCWARQGKAVSHPAKQCDPSEFPLELLPGYGLLILSGPLFSPRNRSPPLHRYAHKLGVSRKHLATNTTSQKCSFGRRVLSSRRRGTSR